MTDIRKEIAERHGIPQFAGRLVGATAAELEADAAAIASLANRQSESEVLLEALAGYKAAGTEALTEALRLAHRIGEDE